MCCGSSLVALASKVLKILLGVSVDVLEVFRLVRQPLSACIRLRSSV